MIYICLEVRCSKIDPEINYPGWLLCSFHYIKISCHVFLILPHYSFTYYNINTKFLMKPTISEPSYHFFPRFIISVVVQVPQTNLCRRLWRKAPLPPLNTTAFHPDIRIWTYLYRSSTSMWNTNANVCKDISAELIHPYVF